MRRMHTSARLPSVAAHVVKLDVDPVSCVYSAGALALIALFPTVGERSSAPFCFCTAARRSAACVT